MMTKLLRIVLIVSMLYAVSGCSSFRGISEKSVPEETRLIVPPAGNFNKKMKDLADQLDKNASEKTLSNTYIVTSFTNLDKLSDTSALGRLIAENLMHGLQLNMWQILEIRLSKGVDVNAAGEFSLSRETSKLKDEYKISGIVTGTYSVTEGNVTINARVIDVNTGLLTSSAQTYIPLAGLPDASVSHDNSNRSMKIISDGIK